MLKMSKTWAFALMLSVGLTSVAGAGFVDDWDEESGYGWFQNGPLNGHDGWVSMWEGSDLRVTPGVGYLGSKGVTDADPANDDNRVMKPLGEVNSIRSGRYTFPMLLNVSGADTAGGESIAGFLIGDNPQMWVGNHLSVNVRGGLLAGDSTRIDLRNGASEATISAGAVLPSLGWIELQIVYNLDNDSARVRWCDVDDERAAYIGDFVELGGFPGPAPTFDVTYIGLRTSATHIPAGSAFIDGLGIGMPEPGTLCLLAVGWVVLIRRRRK